MSEPSYTEKVDMMWAAFQEQYQRDKLKAEAKTKGVHFSTLKAELRHAPPMSELELLEAKARFPKGRYITSEEYGKMLNVEDEDDRIALARRHCYWLTRDKYLFYDSKRRAYTDTLVGDVI